MNHPENTSNTARVEVLNRHAASQVVVICEHASAFIPPEFKDLGLAPDALEGHVVWDPGAKPVAEKMAEHLDAVLVAAGVSRLVYDCNRPPEAEDAMPARSELVEVPGNQNLTVLEKARRVSAWYEPFRDAVSAVLSAKTAPVIVTVHSFTPVYHGRTRDVEIGVLHDQDTRLADVLLAQPPASYDVRRNDPYGPQDGVTHTLREHALPRGCPNVMLEVRNDLIADAKAQARMATLLADWVSGAVSAVQADAC
ncbi:N-formylglutamate amidohydrolase [uncultured Roseobacter sp.]|uniref:N-formylglutamate amidohydrolase n=1 Tax=uncultured Roseobacter sp. TaxID=114847 RepID=UPI0026026ED2|nr:N-formylglutamate amidohydrolase [uncultured Roseobacter sp.]